MGKEGREGIKGEAERERKRGQGWGGKGVEPVEEREGEKGKRAEVILPQQFSKVGAYGPTGQY